MALLMRKHVRARPVDGNMAIYGQFVGQYVACMSSISMTDPLKCNQLTWVIDSGCSRHMTYLQDVLDDCYRLQVPITINNAK